MASVLLVSLTLSRNDQDVLNYNKGPTWLFHRLYSCLKDLDGTDMSAAFFWLATQKGQIDSKCLLLKLPYAPLHVCLFSLDFRSYQKEYRHR